jgi:homoserine dehydrogenase
MRVGVVGAGHIGSELCSRLEGLGAEVAFVLKTSGVYKHGQRAGPLEDLPSHADGLDAAFLAIPTLDDGRAAFDYLRFFLGRGTPVVTCEKGALSNYFAELSASLDKVGYSATVGGGTRMLRYLEERSSPASRVDEVHAVVNGTLNYVFDQVAKGRSLAEVVDETKKLGYAEPGAVTPLDVVNKEAAEDVPMKASILFNIFAGRKAAMRARDVFPRRIGESELKTLVREASNRRYMVSFTREDGEEDAIGGFTHRAGEWTVSAGFKRVSDNPLYQQLVPTGVNNALLVSEGRYGREGTYRLTGPGAGAGPTVSAMLNDANRILARK